MISYLVDAVLLVALAFTSMRVTRMHRELARLRSYQGEFSTIVQETSGAFDTVIRAAHDSTAKLGRLVNRIRLAPDCERWQFGAAALMRHLARRGVI